MKKIFFLSVCLLTFYTNICSQSAKMPNTFLWRISGNGLAKPSYLYGTFHLNDKKLFYFGDSLYAALESSNGFAAELNLDSLVSYMIREMFKKEKGKKLKDVLDKETFRKIEKKLEKKIGKKATEITTTDIKEETSKTLKESYKKGEMGGFMDAYLYNIAKKQGKWVGGIEDMEDQMDLINDDDFNIDAEYILQATSDDEEAFLTKMIAIYVAEDLESLNEMYGNKLKNFTDKFLIARNKKMTHRIDSLGHIRNTLFTVGVAHLPGEQGVINLLQQKGYIVEPVFSSKKIAPENYTYKKVEKEWITNYDDDSTFSFETPEKASLVPYNGIPLKFYMTYDLGTTTGYYFLNIKTKEIDNEEEIDSVFNTMLQSISKNSKTENMEHKKITQKNMEGIDALNYSKSENIYLRLNFFYNKGQLYLLQYSSKLKEDCYSANAERFFNSWKVYKKIIKEKTTFVSDSNFLYTVQFPGNEYKEVDLSSLTAENLKEWNFQYTMYLSTNLQNVYMLFVKETKPTFYISSDTIMFNNIIQDIESKKYADIKTRFISFKQMPTLSINAIIPEKKLKYKAISFLHGNRQFMLMSFYAQEDTASIEQFFNSFNILTTPSAIWKQEKLRNDFICYTPSSFVAEDTTNNEESKTYAYNAYDKYTTATYHIDKDLIKKYQYWDDDTTLLNTFIKNASQKLDSVIAKNIEVTSQQITTNFIIASPREYNYKQYKTIIYADTIVTLYRIIPKLFFDEDGAKQFFDKFQILHKPTTSITALNDKVFQFFTDVESKDSTTREEAVSGFYDIHFSKKHLPLLHNKIEQIPADSLTIYGTPYYFAEQALIQLSDSSTVDFLSQKYLITKENINKAKWIYLLLNMQNEYAKNAAEKLLLQNPPHKGSIEEIGYQLALDSGKKTAFIMQLMPLTKDSLWATALARLATEIIDSNYLPKKDLLPYENNFIKEAIRKIEDLKQKDSSDYSVTYYWILKLMGSYNTKNSNAILQNFLNVKKKIDVLYEAATALLKNKQQVTISVLLKIARDDFYRLSFYDFLKTEKQLVLFPKQYLTQKHFAISYLKQNIEEDEEIESAVFIKEKIFTYKNKKLKFYLYKVKFSADEKTYLGIAGGFDVNSLKVEVTENISGIYFENEFDKNKVDELFEQYINQMSEEPPVVEALEDEEMEK